MLNFEVEPSWSTGVDNFDGEVVETALKVDFVGVNAAGRPVIADHYSIEVDHMLVILRNDELGRDMGAISIEKSLEDGNGGRFYLR